MPNKVIAVVVTYNRILLLKRCLDALLAQSTRPAGIIVIDNASSDGTAQTIARTYTDKVTLIQLSRNTGGAGGFYIGCQAAISNGADWIWLMDDDGYPDP